MNTKAVVTSGIFTALICIFSAISLPVGAVPVSLSLFAIVLVAVVTGARFAAFSVASYILLGAAGLPVFAGFGSGLPVLFGPTGGFIWSYIFVAIIVGSTIKKSEPLLWLSAFASLIFTYAIGTLWFSIVQSVPIVSALAVCVVPFVGFDVAKIILAIVFGKSIRRRLR
ncbi:MAG: biotin transporter BioY [Clostridia bacterium]|nr:biotin transporter BioY [Clostridia bacterium]